MSIIDDFAAIGSKLAEIEKKPIKAEDKPHQEQLASKIAECWMYTPSEYAAPDFDPA